MMCLTEMCDRVIRSLTQRIALRYLATSFGFECGPVMNDYKVKGCVGCEYLYSDTSANE